MRRMIFHVSPRLASLALALAAVSGCGTEPGSLIIPFSIGASSVTCENVGVDTVRMVLTEISEEGSADPVSYEGEAPCADGEVEFTGIAIGNYELEVKALASDGVTVFDNEAPESLKKVEALEGQTVTSETVELTPTPAQIFVRWDLGQFVQCANVMTQQFEVALYADGGVTKLLTAEPIACDAPADAEGYHLVPDPDRKIDGNRVDTIDVAPQTSSGDAVGSVVPFMGLTPPGYGRPIRLTLSCTGDACTGQVDP